MIGCGLLLYDEHLGYRGYNFTGEYSNLFLC